jgi:hypothetical protein
MMIAGQGEGLDFRSSENIPINLTWQGDREYFKG